MAVSGRMAEIPPQDRGTDVAAPRARAPGRAVPRQQRTGLPDPRRDRRRLGPRRRCRPRRACRPFRNETRRGDEGRRGLKGRPKTASLGGSPRRTTAPAPGRDSPSQGSFTVCSCGESSGAFTISAHADRFALQARAPRLWCQSDRAMLVRRGVQRLMAAWRVALLPEMALASGRRADLVGLTEKGEVLIVEIKTSIEDFLADRKWPDYRQHCYCLYFATHPGVPAGIFPEECGLILRTAMGPRCCARRRSIACGPDPQGPDAALRPRLRRSLAAGRMGGEPVHDRTARRALRRRDPGG